MAKKTLTYLRVFNSGDFLGNHVEMHHVVTRRRLMTLSAVARCGGRVSKFWNRPRICPVALRAISTEQAKVFVFRPVTTRAIEEGFLRISMVPQTV